MHKPKKNYTKTDDAEYLYIVMHTYLINTATVSFPGNRSSFKSKIKVTRKARAIGTTKDVRIAAPFKYLSTFWRTIVMLLINCD